MRSFSAVISLNWRLSVESKAEAIVADLVSEMFIFIAWMMSGSDVEDKVIELSALCLEVISFVFSVYNGNYGGNVYAVNDLSINSFCCRWVFIRFCYILVCLLYCYFE